MKPLYLVFFLFVISCASQGDEKKETGRSYEQIIEEKVTATPKSDSLALGFRLKQSEDEVNSHFQYLVDNNKVSPQTDWQAYALTIKGVYPYELFLNDTLTIETYVTHSFHNDSLATITFFGDLPLTNPKYNYSDIYEWMKKRFGEPDFIETGEDKKSTNYHWFDGYKQISLAKVGSYIFAIEYNDLRAIIEKRNLEAKLDSLKGDMKKEKFNASKDDIK